MQLPRLPLEVDRQSRHLRYHLSNTLFLRSSFSRDNADDQGSSWHQICIDKINELTLISDIDGTITKSDVLGHVLPIIGRDWAQSGVASLFTKIRDNGYHIAYLSARAIGQAPATKDYLKTVSQEDLNLPGNDLSKDIKQISQF